MAVMTNPAFATGNTDELRINMNNRTAQREQAERQSQIEDTINKMRVVNDMVNAQAAQPGIAPGTVPGDAPMTTGGGFGSGPNGEFVQTGQPVIQPPPQPNEAAMRAIQAQQLAARQAAQPAQPAPPQGVPGQAPQQAPAQPGQPQQVSPREQHEKNKEVTAKQTAAHLARETQPESLKLLDEARKSGNKTDQAAIDDMDSILEKRWQNMMLGGNLTNEAEAFEKEMKERPWYKNNRIWGAAIATGLTLLAGGDPRLGIIAGTMAYGKGKENELEWLGKLRIKDAASAKAYSDRLDKYMTNKKKTAREDSVAARDRRWAQDDAYSDRVAALEDAGRTREQALADAKRERGQAVADREDEQAFKKEQTKEERTYAYQKEVVAAKPQLREIDKQIEASQARVSSNDDLIGRLDESSVDMTGPLAQYRGKFEKFKDTPEGNLFADLENWRTREVPGKLEAMRGLGSMSEVEFKAMTKDIPGPDAHLNEIKAYMKRIAQFERKAQTHLKAQRKDLLQQYPDLGEAQSAPSRQSGNTSQSVLDADAIVGL